MTVTISRVNTAIDNFYDWLTKTNALIDAVSNNAVTISTAANGSLSTGNGFITGIFGVNTFAATVIRGGNVQANGTLTIYANTLALNNTFSIGNSTVNVVANSTTINAAVLSTQANSTSGFYANTTAIWINGTTYTTLDGTVAVQSNASAIGSRHTINFIQGTGATLTVADNPGSSRVDVTISAISNSSAFVGGTNTMVQFNDSGIIGGNTNFTFDKITGTVAISNTVSVPRIELSNGGRLTSFYTNSSTTSAVVIDSWLLADYRSGEYVLSIGDRNANNFAMAKILMMHDGGSIYMSEYGSIYSNTDIATFTASINATHAILNYASTSTNSYVKGVRTLLAI